MSREKKFNKSVETRLVCRSRACFNEMRTFLSLGTEGSLLIVVTKCNIAKKITENGEQKTAVLETPSYIEADLVNWHIKFSRLWSEEAVGMLKSRQ